MFNHFRFGQSRLSRIRCGVGRLWLGPWRCQRSKLSSRTVHQPLEALYSTILALQLCNIAAVSASMKCDPIRIRLQDRLREECECGKVCPSRESRLLSNCSVVGPRIAGDASIRESYSRSQCRLRLLAIAALGQHHVQLAHARRAKCHTYQSTLLPPGPSRVVVDTALQLGCSSSSVIIPHLVLPYPCACFFSPAHIPPNTSEPLPLSVHDREYLALWIHDATLLCQRWTPPSTPPSPKVFTSRPLGTAPANHSTLPNPTRETDVIDPGTPPQPQSIKTITTISRSTAGDLQKSKQRRIR